ncbi:MAG: Zn-ribbon domain-containing OB-fold protein, partial [Anaerolineales bacterium]
EVCPHCEKQIFPPRDICPDCGNEARDTYNFSGKGEVYSYSTLYDAPAGHEEQAPYTVALVQLEEGPMVTAQLTDLDEQQPEIGMPVEMVTRKLRADGDRGILVYGYKFRPVLSAI